MGYRLLTESFSVENQLYFEVNSRSKIIPDEPIADLRPATSQPSTSYERVRDQNLTSFRRDRRSIYDFRYTAGREGVVGTMPLAKPREGESIGLHVYPAVSDEGTLGDPETVIWSSISHLCSASVAAGWAARVHGVHRKTDRLAVARNLKLYVQQAHEFYNAAQNAKPNTAPLIYYYSFLNLAKALCELNHPRFHRLPECYRHGISWKPHRNRLVDVPRETISISGRGVWHVLWESLMHAPCTVPNPTRLSIKILFSYCPEISVEILRSLNARLKLIEIVAPDMLYDGKTSEVWLRLSFFRENLKRLRMSVPALRSQIETARSSYTEVKSTERDLRTLQSTTARKLGRAEGPWRGLQTDILRLNLFAHLGRESKLGYYIPVQAGLPLRMPQLMVSYTILFWLGSLVRYDPHSVDALKDSEYWTLIDGFMSQSRLWLLELFEWAFYQAETTLWTTR